MYRLTSQDFRFQGQIASSIRRICAFLEASVQHIDFEGRITLPGGPWP